MSTDASSDVLSDHADCDSDTVSISDILEEQLLAELVCVSPVVPLAVASVAVEAPSLFWAQGILESVPASSLEPAFVTVAVAPTDSRIARVRAFRCTYSSCSSSFKTNSQLRKHVRVHTKERPFKCSVCVYAAAESGSLTSHMRTHTGEKPYKCTICTYAARRADTMLAHMRVHTGERPFPCPHTPCGFAARSSGHLKTHVRTHTGERPYTCTICPYRTTESGALKSHLRTHSGELPYECSVCGFLTSAPSSLKVHFLRNHGGEQPLKCGYCKFSTSFAKAFERHMTQKHGNVLVGVDQAALAATPAVEACDESDVDVAADPVALCCTVQSKRARQNPK